jgi:hypothetical protein
VTLRKLGFTLADTVGRTRLEARRSYTIPPQLDKEVMQRPGGGTAHAMEQAHEEH